MGDAMPDLTDAEREAVCVCDDHDHARDSRCRLDEVARLLAAARADERERVAADVLSISRMLSSAAQFAVDDRIANAYIFAAGHVAALAQPADTETTGGER